MIIQNPKIITVAIERNIKTSITRPRSSLRLALRVSIDRRRLLFTSFKFSHVFYKSRLPFLINTNRKTIKNTNNDNKMASVSMDHSFRQKRKTRLGCDAV